MPARAELRNAQLVALDVRRFLARAMQTTTSELASGRARLRVPQCDVLTEIERARIRHKRRMVAQHHAKRLEADLAERKRRRQCGLLQRTRLRDQSPSTVATGSSLYLQNVKQLGGSWSIRQRRQLQALLLGLTSYYDAGCSKCSGIETQDLTIRVDRSETIDPTGCVRWPRDCTRTACTALPLLHNRVYLYDSQEQCAG